MEILNYKNKIGDPKIYATFDLYLGPVSTITYPNMRVKHGKNGGYFVSRPSYLKSEDATGKKVFGSYPEMSDEKWKSLSQKINEMIKPFLDLADQNPPFPQENLTCDYDPIF